MEFLLLGPVEVRAGDQTLNCGGPRQRSVLASLAVDVGRPVLPEVLIDRVWGSDVPNRARHALHVYVGRIRRMLSDASPAYAEPASLSRVSGGYRLDTDPDLIDMHRFARLITEGRNIATPGSAKGELLRRALDLWRAEPLADLSGEWAMRVRESWRQRRLDAATRWAAIELTGGDPGAVAGLLTELVSDYPLDESIAALLIRALHEAGRPADAIDCYTRIRERLIDQLGVEPAEDLRNAHMAVVRGDAKRIRTEVRAVGTLGERSQTPAELPADIADFVGRTEETERLMEVLGSTSPRTNDRAVSISVLAGRAGVGKTTLAVHVGHRLRGRFPDGQLYVDLRGADPNPTKPANVLIRFCRALGVDESRLPQAVEDLAALFRSRMAERKLLVVLDNAASEAQVRPLIPGSSGCAVVVTSRRRLTGLPGADLVGLQALEPEHAVELLAQVVGRWRLTRQPAAARAIARLCGHLPLALRISGARLAARQHWDLAVVADRLADERRRLDELVHADLDVRASLALSYRSLSPMAKSTMQYLAIAGLPTYTAHTAAVVNDHCGSSWDSIMEELADVHLLDAVGVDGNGCIRYRFHDLIRLYAAEQTMSADQPYVGAIVERILHWYEMVCGAGNAIVDPTHNRFVMSRPQTDLPFQSTVSSVSRWIEDEWPNLRATVQLAVSNRHDEVANHLSYFVAGFAKHLGQWTESLAINLDAEPAVERMGDDVSLGLQYNSMAIACIRLRRFNDALVYLRRSLAARRAANDRRGEGATWTNIGMVYQNLFRLEEAVDAYQRGYDCCTEANHPVGVAVAANNLGVAYLLLGELDRSFMCLCESLLIRREQGDRNGEAYTLESLGETYAAHGDYEDALRCFEEGLALDVGDRWLTGEIQRNIGLVHRQRGDHSRALEYSMSAAQTFRDASDAHNESVALIDAAQVTLAFDDLPETARLLEGARALREEVPDAIEEDRLRAAMAALTAAESRRRP